MSSLRKWTFQGKAKGKREKEKVTFAFLLFPFFFFTFSFLPGAAPTKEEIAKAIQQLGDKDFSVREKASAFLYAAGEAAEPALCEAAKSSDLEVAHRARAILDKFKYGLYPGTPEKIVKLVHQYQSRDPHQQQAAVRGLFREGGKGYRVLMKLASAEESPEIHRRLFQQMAQEAARAGTALVMEGNYALAEELLEMAAHIEAEPAARHWAALLLLRGSLDDKIRQYRSRAELPDGRDDAKILTYLYRAKGDLAQAQWAAERAGYGYLLKQILRERGDWKTLQGKEPDLRTIPSLGFQAAYQRLSGNHKELKETLAKIQDLASRGPRDETVFWFAAKALFLNDRPQDAIDLLIKGRDYLAAFELLCAQHRYQEALALANRLQDAEIKNWIALEIQKGRVLYLLGEKDAALQIFSSRIGNSKSTNPKDYDELRSLIEVENKFGLKQLALDHCALLLEGSKQVMEPAVLLEEIFPDNGKTAVLWWSFFRHQFAAEKPAVSLRRVADVFNGKVAGKEFDSLLDEVERWAAQPGTYKHLVLQPLANTCRIAGREDLARVYLERDGTAASLTQLGDWWTKKNKWKEAADCYARAWEKDQKQIAALYLQGWALTKTGQAKQGQKLTDQAHLVPLGNEEMRYQLAEALEKRDLAEPARREHDLILRVGAFDSWYAGNAWRQKAYDAVAKKDHLAAADCFERAMLDCLNPNTTFAKTEAYLIVPCWVHYYRGRGLLAAGKVDEVLKEVDLCQAALPGDVDIAIDFLPALEQRGRKKEASKIFQRVYDLYDKQCTDYPKSAWVHNSFAWLCARCRRDLAKALQRSEKAVELAPESSGYLDTLAEVHFQRGHTIKAAELMKKCIALDPKNEYFRKQLKRFEAGDPNADLPPN